MLPRAIDISSSIDSVLIVFSDLDGSLLDHDTYDWRPAKPALDRIEEQCIPLIPVSSKTAAELEIYREQLHLRHPMVAENGAALCIPADYFPDTVTFPAARNTRARLQSVYEDLKLAHAFRCEAFYELGIPGIVRETGLSERQAVLANDRQASEPILWRDSDERATQFQQAALSRGLRCVRGGRFLHLMGNTGKAEAVKQLLRAYAAKWPGKTCTSVSLGDAPNDLGMLSATDIAVIIPGRHTHRMTVDARNRVLRPVSAGPAGWNSAMMSLLAEHYDKQATARGDGG